jgi:long-chain acyl-CoA synthetase
MIPYTSLPDILVRQDANIPQQMALFSRHIGDSHSSYVGLTYGVVYQRALAFALGLSALEIHEGSKVSILSNNRPEWVISDMGTLMIGAITVPVYATLSASEIMHIVQNSESEAIVVETPTHLEHVLKYTSVLPHLRLIICLFEQDSLPEHTGLTFISYSSLIRLGETEPEGKRLALLDHIRTLSRDQLASIVYTSGTTGAPKGVMLTHGHFLSNVEDIIAVTPLSSEDRLLSFLPLSHAFERTVGYYTALAVGAKIYYAENMTTVSADLLEAKPTILVSVPRLYEKIHDKIFDSLKGFKLKLFSWAFSVGKRALEQHCFSSLSYRIADRLVFSKIRAKTGGQLRFFVSGGAPLSADLGVFFKVAGLQIIEGYGLTETSPVIACNRLDAYRFGTVGQALPSQTVRLADDGELLVKGPNVMMGYYLSNNRPNPDFPAVDSEGWFHTGDIAEISEDGFIRIVDRKKELLVLSNGKNIPPQVIEQKLCTSPYIAQAIVIGDRHPFVTALIVPQFPKLSAAIGQPILPGQESVWVQDPAVHAFIEAELNRVQAEMSNYEKVKKFTLLAAELTPESGALTPTLKPKRKVIYQLFYTQIQAMYEAPREDNQ